MVSGSCTSKSACRTCRVCGKRTYMPAAVMVFIRCCHVACPNKLHCYLRMAWSMTEGHLPERHAWAIAVSWCWRNLAGVLVQTTMNY